MGYQKIEKILKDAIDIFLKKDIGLLSIEVNERSLTHKFAEYLQQVIGNSWNVDCEYNRYGNETKTIDNVKDIVGHKTETDDTKSKTIYPDIIIHKRGTAGHNLLVI
jgi:hypothetical protein